jgi:integrase
MPRRQVIPAYRHHKHSGQAVVTIDQRDHYLGVHGSPESKVEYERLVRAILADRVKEELKARVQASTDLTIAELFASYKAHARQYYTKNGVPTSEFGLITRVIDPLVEQHGYELVTGFGPAKLKALRQQLVERGVVRTSANKMVERVRRAFAWAVEEELCPVEILQSLQAIAGLRKGRTAAPQGKKVLPVPDAWVDAIRPHVGRRVRAMIELQRLTGMRPGEVIIMRACDPNTQGQTWEYVPAWHKTEHHERSRTIFIGREAREILRPWLRTELEAYLFDPREDRAERSVDLRAKRKTPVQPSQQNRRKKRPKRAPRERYDRTSYTRAIARACRKAGVPHWSPNQLRHNAATKVRRECGLDVARAVLGHSSPAMTLLYAEMDATKAAEAMERLG